MVSFFVGFLFYLLVDKPIRNIDTHVLFPTKISDSFLVKRNQRSNNLFKAGGGGGSGHSKDGKFAFLERKQKLSQSKDDQQ